MKKQHSSRFGQSSERDRKVINVISHITIIGLSMTPRAGRRAQVAPWRVRAAMLAALISVVLLGLAMLAPERTREAMKALAPIVEVALGAEK